MTLVDEQLQTLKAAILAETDPTFVEYRTNGQTTLMASWFNLPHPTAIVWRSAVTKDEIYANGFNWVAVDDVTDLKWRVWMAMFDNRANSIKPSKPNVRAGIQEVWKGNATKLGVQDYVFSKCKRPATKGEALFAPGGTTLNPATLAEDDITITDYDIGRALAL